MRTISTPTPSRLRRALPAPARLLLDHAVAAAGEQERPLWAVGGTVRDLAGGLPVRDIDLAVEARSARAVMALARAVAARAGGRAEERSRELATARVVAGDARLDLAALRTERYARPGALPEARLSATIEQDLARRDFTVNAMALALAGGVAGVGGAGARPAPFLDPYDGLDDLAAGRLRVLHERSFVEDATRLWRGARTAAPLNLRPEPETARLIVAGGRWLGRVSGERIYAEFRLTGERRYAYRASRLLDHWGVLRATHEAFRLLPQSARALRTHPGPHSAERYAAVLLAPLDEREAVLARLRAPGSVREAVGQAAALLTAGGAGLRRGPLDPDALEPLTGAPPAAREAARWLDPAPQRALQRDLVRWEHTQPHLDARALMAMGVPQGPELGRLLRCLRRERYLGNLRTAADARRFVERQMAERHIAGDATGDVTRE